MVRSGCFWGWWLVGYQLLPSQEVICSNESCFVSFSYSKIKGKGKKAVTLFAVALLCDRISGLEENVD